MTCQTVSLVLPKIVKVKNNITILKNTSFIEMSNKQKMPRREKPNIAADSFKPRKNQHKINN